MPYPRIEVSVKYKGGSKRKPAPTVECGNTAAHVVRQIVNTSTILWVEEVLLLCLNKANRLVGWYRAGIGGMESANVDVRVLATVALKCTATRVILAHNHPSGELQASAADLRITHKAKLGLKLIDIDLLDHIIITDQGHLSMKEQGIL